MSRPLQPLVHVSIAVFDGPCLLLVQEEKPDVRGLWNLPGGHLHREESIQGGARRELGEETELSVPLRGLVGVYSCPVSVRFVFRAECDGETARAGHEILQVSWRSLEDIQAMADDELSAPPMMRSILGDLERGTVYPLEALVEQLP